MGQNLLNLLSTFWEDNDTFRKASLGVKGFVPPHIVLPSVGSKQCTRTKERKMVFGLLRTITNVSQEALDHKASKLLT